MKGSRNDLINIKCQSNKNSKGGSRKSTRKSLYELSLSLFLSVWCIVFLFYSNIGLSHGNGGNSLLPDNSTSYPSTSNDKPCNCAYPYDANESYSHSNEMLIEFNITVNCNDSIVHGQETANSKHALQKTPGLEDVVWSVLGYSALMCDLGQQEEEQRANKTEQLRNGRTHPTYLDLDEFRNITRQEKGVGMPSQIVNISHRIEHDGEEYNYASASKGAKVLAHNKEAKGASNILGKDHDKYLRNPCSVGGKFVIVELAEETLVDVVKIANFEHYSSNFKEFELSGSLSYPTNAWFPLGNFVAANVKHIQSFKLPEPKWVRYLKLNLLSHYGSASYCTLSVLEVYGVDAIKRMLEDLIVASVQPTPSKLPTPNTTEMPSLNPEPSPSDGKGSGGVQDGVQTAKGIESISDVQKINIDLTMDPATINNIPDPILEVRQQSSGRIPGDTVLKILMQKVKSLELNLSVLEEYIRELNRRQGDALPELDKELSRISLLLEKSRTEIRDLMEWKEIMEEGITDLLSWRSFVSSQVNALVKENIMMRLDVERVLRDQKSLENKELTVLVVGVFFVCTAILKLVSKKTLKFLGVYKSDNNVYRTSRGWMLILVSSSLIIFITLLFS